MKKFISLFLSAALFASATGCSSQANVDQVDPVGNADSTPTTQQSPQPVSDTKDDVLQGEITGTIDVSCYDTMRYKGYLEEAAVAFEAKYPGTKINISTFSKMPEAKTTESDGKKLSIMIAEDDTQERTDYINKINTELMSGKGADILAMDILPYYKYAQSGQLEDLNQYMEADSAFNLSDYKENIVKAAQYQQGQYILPIDYNFDFFAYDSSLFSEEEQKAFSGNSAFTYEQLMEIGQAPYAAANSDASKDHIEMFGMDPRSMYNVLWKESGKKFIDIESKTVNFDSGEFVNLLESVMKYPEEGYIKEGNKKGAKMSKGNIDKDNITLDAFEKDQSEQFLYKSKSSFSLLQYFNTGNRHMLFFGGGGGSAGNEDNDKIAGLVSGADGANVYSNMQAYGLNANSSNKTTAWEFMKFLAGEEMQTSMNLMGLPINNKARAEKAKLEVTGAYYSPERNNESSELTAEQMEVFNSYTKAVEDFSDMINTYPVQDTTINAIVDTEIAHYFDGSKTAEEVAATLQNRIQLYLNE